MRLGVILIGLLLPVFFDLFHLPTQGNKEGGILMDTQTKRALVLNDRLTSCSMKVGGTSSALYSAGPAMVVKGLSEPVATFRLLPLIKRVVGASSLTKEEGESTRGQLLGREREIALLSTAITHFLEDSVKGSQWGKAHSIFLSGPAGEKDIIFILSWVC